MAQRRTKFEIMAEILRIDRKGTIKTRIVYNANLNFLVLDQYVKELQRSGLIENGVEDSGVLRTTEKGMRYLKRYDEFRHFLDDLVSESPADSFGFMGAN